MITTGQTFFVHHIMNKFRINVTMPHHTDNEANKLTWLAHLCIVAGLAGHCPPVVSAWLWAWIYSPEPAYSPLAPLVHRTNTTHIQISNQHAQNLIHDIYFFYFHIYSYNIWGESNSKHIYNVTHCMHIIYIIQQLPAPLMPLRCEYLHCSPGEQMPSASKMLCLQMGFRVSASNMGPMTLSKVWLVYRLSVHFAFLYTRHLPKPKAKEDSTEISIVNMLDKRKRLLSNNH